MKTKYTYEQIASDFRLWGEYVDPNGMDSESTFNERSMEEKIAFIRNCFGEEPSVKTKHTPLKWEARSRSLCDNSLIIASEDLTEVCCIRDRSERKYGEQDNVDMANAEFICKAVNCHEELLEACMAAERYYLPTPVMIQLRNAIAKAGVELS